MYIKSHSQYLLVQSTIYNSLYLNHSDNKKFSWLKLRCISKFLKLLLDLVLFCFPSESQWHYILQWGAVPAGFLALWHAVHQLVAFERALFYFFSLRVCHLSELAVWVGLRKVLQMTLLCTELNLVLHILVKLCKSLLILLISWIQPQVWVLFSSDLLFYCIVFLCFVN